MISKESALQKISELVERFEEQYDFYKKSDYNETLTGGILLILSSKH